MKFDMKLIQKYDKYFLNILSLKKPYRTHSLYE